MAHDTVVDTEDTEGIQFQSDGAIVLVIKYIDGCYRVSNESGEELVRLNGATGQIEKPKPDNFYIGQRVLLFGYEIGVVQKGPEHREGHTWVHSPSKGYSSCYANHNVRPLPNGEL